ncbi:MAG: hypothetical protein HS104_30845 [Polyangiaceae bacterium]|nr:hypothetical protein [Polyangiaceae bacterium]
MRRLWDVAPILESTCLSSVCHGVACGDPHGATGHLSEQELADLIAFLESL